MTEDQHQAAKNAILDIKAKWKRAGSLSEIRESFDTFLQAGREDTARRFEIGGLPAAWIGSEIEPSPETPVVLYCHGGGFQIGSIRSHYNLATRISAACGMHVLVFEYRLAPESRFPAAHEDALAVYDWLIGRGHASQSIAVAADSAGASLALGIVSTFAQRDQNSLPGCVALLSPWLDLTLSGDSYQSRRDFDVFSEPDQLRAMARTYIGKSGDRTAPHLNPLSCDWGTLPPTTIHVGDYDITRDDGIRLAEKAGHDGASVELVTWPQMYHHFQVFPDLAESAASIEQIGTFIKRHLTNSA
jgi:epsilon-lactone hydrolase